MIEIIYNENRTIFFEKVKISKGSNLVSEKVFRKMLEYPFFSSRIESGDIIAPDLSELEEDVAEEEYLDENQEYIEEKKTSKKNKSKKK